MMSMVVFVPGNVVGKKLDLPTHFPFLKQWGLFLSIDAILVVIEPRSCFAELFLSSSSNCLWPIFRSAPSAARQFNIWSRLAEGQRGSGVSVAAFSAQTLPTIYLLLERGGGREKERERNISVWLPLTWPATQACTLTGN